MSSRRRGDLGGRRVGRLTVAAIAGGVVAAASLGPIGAQAAPTPNPALKKALSQRAKLPKGLQSQGSMILGRDQASEKLDPSLRAVNGKVAVMIELDAAPASSAFGLSRAKGVTAAKAAAKRQTDAVKASQRAVEAHFSQAATQARTMYRTHALYSGIAVTTDASKLKALAALPGVKAIHRLTPKSPTNSSSVPLIGAPAVWKAKNQTGKGVRVGIIDTGVDYTHADFGGPGTVAAFDAAKASTTFTGTPKVVGGYDFVGDAYNADPNSKAFNPVEAPDTNPLDCNGHGSHTAGTTAGLGVTKAGDTYTGSYATDIPAGTFSIGPGVAPGASIYALKVFGCAGSTNAVGEALDWAADPNGDGDVSDHLDVVNMSLGSSYGSPDDPDAVASDRLAALGTVVVASIGNSGDVYEVGGSPGNAPRVLGVAATDDGNDVVDGLKVDSPAGLEPSDTVDGDQDNVFAALKSVAYDWTNGAGVTNTSVAVVGDWTQPPSATNNTDGCSPYSAADAAAIAGKVVLQMWLDGTGRRCGSAGRTANARNAGAAGAILGSDVNAFSAGITGDATLPAMLAVNQATVAIKNAVLAGTDVKVTMTNALRNAVTIKAPQHIDQLAGFSSRGIGSADDVKPDVAAPGVTTFSVAVGTGNEGIAESGTSMASPHVAGEAALVRATHPGWSVEQVKAAIMNTATQDVYVGENHTGAVYGPERVGSGRVKVDDAVNTPTLAYAKDGDGAVSISFGTVEVTGTTTRTKTIHVVNTRPTGTVKYTLGYAPAVETPGVSYSVSPSELSLAAGESADVEVTMTATAADLRHTPDPTIKLDPLGLGLERSFRTSASGRVVLTPVGGTTGHELRVPVWAAPRPASVMQAESSTTVEGDGPVKTGTLDLDGKGVDQGGSPEDHTSSISALQLQAKSDDLPDCSSTKVTDCIALKDDRSADLRYVGTASDAPLYTANDLDPTSADPAGNGSVPPALMYFGVSSWGPWRTPASATEFDVLLDGPDADTAPDAALFNTRVATTDDYDYLISELVDLRPGKVGKVLDQELLNGTDGSFESGLFNSDSMVMPVAISALKNAGIVTDSNSDVHYWVESYTGESGAIDAVASQDEPLSVNAKSPALGATGDTSLAVLNADLPDTALDVRRDDSSLGSDKPLGLFLIHHLNQNGSRAQVVRVKGVPSVKAELSPTSPHVGDALTVTVTVPAEATGLGGVYVDGRWVKSGTLSDGKVTLTLPKLGAGWHTVQGSYGGDDYFTSGYSSKMSVNVLKKTPTVTASLSSTKVSYGAQPTLTVTVGPSDATGLAGLYVDGRWVASKTLSGGKAALVLPKLARGTHTVQGCYGGNGTYTYGYSSKITLTVS